MSDQMALLQALASAAAQQDRGPAEGVHVRAACGFAPTAPYVAEMTRMSPVGPIITRGEGHTREDAVDAAREKYDVRLAELAPPDVRAVLNDPDAARAALLSGDMRELELDAADLGALLQRIGGAIPMPPAPEDN